MLVAVVSRPPVFSGKVTSFKADKTKAMPGVKTVVQVETGVAVIANDFWSANQGRDALEIVWTKGLWHLWTLKNRLPNMPRWLKNPACPRKRGRC